MLVRALHTRPDWRDALVRAKAVLDGLGWYPRPVRLEPVRVLHAPVVFRLPLMRGFDGYTSWNVILLRRDDLDEPLLIHELCHVWQMQHHPIAMPLSYLRTGYGRNPNEEEARRAASHRVDL